MTVDSAIPPGRRFVSRAADFAEHRGLNRCSTAAHSLASWLKRREDRAIIKQLDSAYGVDDPEIAAETEEWIQAARASLKRILESEDAELQEDLDRASGTSLP